MGYELHNFDKLNGEIELEAEDGRKITLRWVKIPTFVNNNNPRYHTIFFVNIDWWALGSAQSIRAICLNNVDIDNQDYTIYLAGKQKGFIMPSEYRHFREHNTMVINTNINKATKRRRSCYEVRKTVFKQLMSLFDTRNQSLKTVINSKLYYYKHQKRKCNIYGLLKQDFHRICDMVKRLEKLFHNFARIVYRIRKDEWARKEFKTTKDEDISNIRNNNSQFLKLLNETNQIMRKRPKNLNSLAGGG